MSSSAVPTMKSPEGMKDKISLFCDVAREAVIPLVTAETIYEVPVMLEDAGLGDLIIRALSLNAAGQPTSGTGAPWCRS